MRTLANPLIFAPCLALFITLLPGLAYGENDGAPAYKEKLGRLQKSIDNIHEHLKGTREKRSHIITELRQLEIRISKNARTLTTTEKNIADLNKHIDQLRKQLRVLALKLKQQRETLSEQMRAAYVLGAQQNMKVLLSQQNPSELGRQQTYFSYLSQAREQEILQFMGSIETSQKTEKELEKSLEAQTKALEKRKAQFDELQKQRLKRNQLLAQLETKIKNQEQTLSELESSRTKIENLLMSLGELLADVPSSPDNEGLFSQKKGRLPWPVKGKFLAHFGEDKDRGGLKWNGVLIEAPYGTPVKSVSHGRVAFADWLQGFGFITIIDHGDGFMSLYGHNESLLKQAGEWVQAGEEIATTGDSGGQPVAGLYFEIRSRGKPVDPDNWCTGKVQHAAAR